VIERQVPHTFESLVIQVLTAFGNLPAPITGSVKMVSGDLVYEVTLPTRKLHGDLRRPPCYISPSAQQEQLDIFVKEFEADQQMVRETIINLRESRVTQVLRAQPIGVLRDMRDMGAAEVMQHIERLITAHNVEQANTRTAGK
jgi:hypothetical protein